MSDPQPGRPPNRQVRLYCGQPPEEWVVSVTVPFERHGRRTTLEFLLHPRCMQAAFAGSPAPWSDEDVALMALPWPGGAR